MPISEPELTNDEIRALVEGFQGPLVRWMDTGLQGEEAEEVFVQAFAAYVKATVEREPDPYVCVAAACAGLLKGLVQGARERMMAAGGKPVPPAA